MSLRIEGSVRMSPTEKLGRDQVFHLLRSPVRTGIIRILGERDLLSFTELRRTFPEISVGTLYYHLDLLAQIVAQNSDKKYILTEEGRRVYAEILRSEEAMISVKTSVDSHSGQDSMVSTILLSRLFADISLRPLKYVSVPFVIFLGIAFSAWISHSIQVLFFFIPVNSVPTWLTASSAAASLLGVYAIMNGITLLLFHRREGNLALLVASSLGLIPLMLYPIVLFAASLTIGQAALARNPLTLALTTAGQALSVLLTSVGLSQSKGLKLERAALIALTTVYFNMLILYLVGFVQI